MEIEKIKHKLLSKVLFNENLSKFSWFNLGGPAKILFRHQSLNELSIYDASYIELAIRFNCSIATLDKKLIDVGSLSDQLISNVPEIFNNIALRSHIRKGRQKIQQLVKYYNERI